MTAPADFHSTVPAPVEVAVPVETAPLPEAMPLPRARALAVQRPRGPLALILHYARALIPSRRTPSRPTADHIMALRQEVAALQRSVDRLAAGML